MKSAASQNVRVEKPELQPIPPDSVKFIPSFLSNMPRHYDSEASRMRISELRYEHRRERELDREEYERRCDESRHDDETMHNYDDFCHDLDDAERRLAEQRNAADVLYLCTVTIPVDGVAREFLSSVSLDRLEALNNLRRDALLIREFIPADQRAAYDKLFWVGEPSPAATPRRALGGDYRAYCTVESIGEHVFPQSSDGMYTLGAATFKLYKTSGGSDEYKRVADLPHCTAAYI